MSAYIRVGPGMRLVAAAVFIDAKGILFISVMGPAAFSFSSASPSGSKEIRNPTQNTWQMSVRASHMGPIGAEVPVRAIYDSASVMLFGVGASPDSPEAVLACAVTEG